MRRAQDEQYGDVGLWLDGVVGDPSRFFKLRLRILFVNHVEADIVIGKRSIGEQFEQAIAERRKQDGRCHAHGQNLLGWGAAGIEVVTGMAASIPAAATSANRRRRSNPILHWLHHSASLVLHQRHVKNRPEVKVGLIGPPKAPTVFIFLPDWKLKQ